jgi:AbiV family abortive infection protein
LIPFPDLQRYNGPLSPEAIFNLERLCFENAEALIEEAKLLNNNGRYARAYALCVLSFEELGKIIMLGGALLYKGAPEWRDFWRGFRHHESKRKIVATIEADMWQLTEDERREHRDMEEFVTKMQ